jgi:hypothetical protein
MVGIHDQQTLQLRSIAQSWGLTLDDCEMCDYGGAMRIKNTTIVIARRWNDDYIATDGLFP